MVYGAGLENQCGATCRGFESHSLRVKAAGGAYCRGNGAIEILRVFRRGLGYTANNSASSIRLGIFQKTLVTFQEPPPFSWRVYYLYQTSRWAAKCRQTLCPWILIHYLERR